MKRILLVSMCALLSLSAFAQPKPPTIMVMPSDAWCEANGYVQTIDGVGAMPDYLAALQNENLVGLINYVNGFFAKVGYPTLDLELVLKEAAPQSEEGVCGLTANQPYNRADIIVLVSWTEKKIGARTSVHLTLRGLNPRTSEWVAGAEEESMSIATPVLRLLQEAVVMSMDSFNAGLQDYLYRLAESEQ